MGNIELFLFFIIYLQPPFFFLLILLLKKINLINIGLNFQLTAPRRRYKAIKFFECAAPSRLGSIPRYSINALVACLSFVVYDVDLIFFFSEVVIISQWSSIILIINCLFLILLILGFMYDKIKTSFNWQW